LQPHYPLDDQVEKKQLSGGGGGLSAAAGSPFM